MVQDATRLDYFVLDKFRALLERGKRDETLDKRLRSRHTKFFLHLLGLDTTGHGYGPHSKVCMVVFGKATSAHVSSLRLQEYINNIQVVDGIVKDVEQMVKEYYKDDRTAFLFT